MTERDGTPPSTVDTPPAAPVSQAARPRPRADEPPRERLSPMAITGIIAVLGLGLAWFLVSWRLLASPVTDAIGETMGSLAVALLLVSIIGAVRSRH